jgi:anti-sigma regulatory factor (Ser/Thr protein kinase)
LIKIVDDAKAFNPLERTDPDVTQELESRQIGGLGIFLVKKIMTEAEYFRKDNKNILILKKSVKTR